MSVTSQRVVSHLLARPGRGICAMCLARELGLPRNTAYDIARKLEGRPDFRREHGTCDACQSERVILRVMRRG